MTLIQILARIAVYFSGWVLTMIFILAFAKEKADMSTQEALAGSLLLSTLAWTLVLGVIYW